MLEDIAILTKGEVISEDLGIKLENVTVSLICLLLSGEASRVFRRLLSVRRSYDDDKEQVFA